MCSELSTSLAAVIDRLIFHFNTDPELKHGLRRVASAFHTIVDPDVSESHDVSVNHEPQSVTLDKIMESEECDRHPTIVQPEIEQERQARHRFFSTPEDSELGDIEARCRMKAIGSRWTAERQRLLNGDSDYDNDIAPGDREVMRHAKASECYLWMNRRDFALPTDLSLLDEMAGCFEAVADGLSLVRSMIESENDFGDLFMSSLELLAEAQSALRVAVLAAKLGDQQPDADQQQTFLWLKSVASQRNFLIERHMRINDPADPTAHDKLRQRISALSVRVEQLKQVSGRRKKLIQKLRFQCKQIRSEALISTEHWSSLLRTVDDLVLAGMPPSNIEIRENLLLVIEKVPGLPPLEDVPKNARLVLREIDRYRNAAQAEAQECCAIEVPSEAVLKVRDLLAGRSLVIIGGESRPGAYQSLKDAFDLQELDWVKSREHQSIDSFESNIANPNVAAVVLAIRWASHAFGDVGDFCEKYGKPLVRLPGGYNPNQVAVQILEQCGNRLRKVDE